MNLPSGQTASRFHVAVVYGPDSEIFVTLGRSRGQLLRRLARYIRRSAPYLLYPEDAQRVANLLSAGDLEGAIDAYFEGVRGDGRKVRWEQQHLVTRRIRCPPAAVVL